MDSLFCTFEGGDDLNYLPPAIYHPPYHIGWNLPTLQLVYLVVFKVGLVSHYIYIEAHI